MTSESRGKRHWREHIPEGEVVQMAEAARTALEEQRKKQENELKHSIKVLEFSEIRKQLAAQAVGRSAKAHALEVEPALTRDDADRLQAETASALRVIQKKGNLPLPLDSPSRDLIRLSEQGSVLSLGDLLLTGQFLVAVRRLVSVIPAADDEEEEHELLYDILQGLVALPDLDKTLTTAILSEDDVADTASPELARIRQQIKRKQESVREHLDVILRSHSRALQENLITLRGDRYVVPVKAAHKGDIPGLVHDTSGSGQTLFIEPLAVVEANNAVLELRAEEREEIYRIRQVLSAQVGQHAQIIASNVKQVLTIDLISARARLAIDMRATQPKLNSEGRIRLVQARHPLIDPKEVVPIDFHLGETFKTLVITGPNTGGKTVTLKTCGLLTLMAMSGLHVPAEPTSELAFFSQVLADIGDEQSIEQSLSTFSAHMRNIVRITEVVDADSLVLMDELGSGTDPSEGAALAQAILNDLRKRGASCVATTHYKELKAYAMQTEGVENASCEFDIHTLRPTYRLLIGVPGVSHAFTISQKLGLSERIIGSAHAFLSTESIQFEELIKGIEEDRRELDEQRARLKQEQEEQAKRRRSIRQDQEKLERRAREIKEQSLQEARRELQEKSQAIDELIKQIRKQATEAHLAGASSDAETLREWVSTDLNRVESEIGKQTRQSLRKRPIADDEERPVEIIVGETYFAPGLNFEGKVLTEPDKSGNVLLEAGVLRVNVQADDLEWPKSKRERKATNASGGGGRSSARMSAKQSFSPELKVIGMRVEDALLEVDRFLDSATLAGAERTRIVHGKGTGALRTAIHDELRRDSRVASYELAAFGEGDSGVTIVTMR